LIVRPIRQLAPARTLASFFMVVAVACGGSSSNSSNNSSSGQVSTPVTNNPPASGPDGGTASNPPSDPPPASTTPALTGITNGAVVAGQVSLAAAVPAGTAAVAFQVDGATVATASAAPFAAVWNSFGSANGAHSIVVQAQDSAGSAATSSAVSVTVGNHIKNIFVIVMENHDWSSIKGSASAPYINGTLLALGAHAENYQNVANLHPSLPNYIWLESGNNQGVADDGGPQSHLLNVPHLTGLMNAAGVTWKSYQEDISGNDCPLNPVNKYFPKHNPALYFSDINGGLNAQSAVCKAHVRPFAELQADLDANTVPSYSFITPNICNDMHDNSGCQSTNSIANGDGWLKTVIPNIMASQAYKDGGLILVTWDESEGGNVPIGMIALSPLAKAGYTSNVAYTHSSTLRSIEEIFGLTPMLGGAANATDLSDMFHSFP
jgi:hypothetical protein